MKNIRVLDCTLRDGGRIIDCAFPDNEIGEITKKLGDAKIDIIEVGFLRDNRNVNYKGNSTFFTDVDQIAPFLDKNNKKVIYVAFIDYGMFNFDSLKPYDGTSIQGIRFGFTKKNYDEHKDDIIKCAQIIKDKGYKLFVQGVNSLNYSDKELLELIEMINEIDPYSFGIVDTYGAMYIDDVDRIYGLIDHNMKENICINFHSHNNYQLSFAFAQEIIKLSNGTRQVIIDGTLNGMGKVAGNLNVELIVDYLVRKMHYDYEFDDLLDIIDDYIYKYSLKYHWGYSIPAMMAGIYKSHPNNIIYLTEKFRLETKDIGKLLSMIDPQLRQRYDYDNIKRIYMDYIADKIDDSKTIEILKNNISDKDVLVIAPGNSVVQYKDCLEEFYRTHKLIVISVNFNWDDKSDYIFFGNQKRYNKIPDNNTKKIIRSSNIKSENNDDYVVNYDSLINRNYKLFDNSTMMLLMLLKKIVPHKIYIAGFDGFDIEKENNFVDSTFQDIRHKRSEFEDVNNEISSMLKEYTETISDKIDLEFITPSSYIK